MKTDKDNLWRENEGREARSKHSEVMAKRIEASDGETTTEWRNWRHPDGDFCLDKEDYESAEILAETLVFCRD